MTEPLVEGDDCGEFARLEEWPAFLENQHPRMHGKFARKFGDAPRVLSRVAQVGQATPDHREEMRGRVSELREGGEFRVHLPEGPMTVRRLAGKIPKYEVAGGGEHIDPDLRRGTRIIHGTGAASEEALGRVRSVTHADAEHTRLHAAHAEAASVHQVQGVNGHSGEVRKVGSRYEIESRTAGVDKSQHETPEAAVRALKHQMRDKGVTFLPDGHDTDPLAVHPHTRRSQAKTAAHATARHPGNWSRAKEHLERVNPDGAIGDVNAEIIPEIMAGNPLSRTALTTPAEAEAHSEVARHAAHLAHDHAAAAHQAAGLAAHHAAIAAQHAHHFLPLAHHVAHLLAAAEREEVALGRLIEEGAAPSDIARAGARVRTARGKVPRDAHVRVPRDQGDGRLAAEAPAGAEDPDAAVVEAFDAAEPRDAHGRWKVWMHSETGHQFWTGDHVHMAGGTGRITGRLVKTPDGPKVPVENPQGHFLVDGDSLRPTNAPWRGIGHPEPVEDMPHALARMVRGINSA